MTGAVLSGNIITVQEGAATVATLTLAAAPAAGTTVRVVADPAGGTDVFLTTAPVAQPPSLTVTSVFVSLSCRPVSRSRMLRRPSPS